MNWAITILLLFALPAYASLEDGRHKLVISYEIQPVNTNDVPAVTLSSVEIVGPVNLGPLTNAQYLAMGTYSDGSVVDVTSSAWWHENGGYTTIDQGMLYVSDLVSTQEVTILSGVESIVDNLVVSLNSIPTPPPAALVSIHISGASSLGESTNSQYVASGIYADVTTNDVTGLVAWFEDNTNTTISSAGLLTVGNMVNTQSVRVAITSDVLVDFYDVTLNGVPEPPAPPVTLASIEITDGTNSMYADDMWQFGLDGIYSDSTTNDLRTTADWTTTDTNISLGLNTGWFHISETLTGTNTAEIIATVGSLSATNGMTLYGNTLALPPEPVTLLDVIISGASSVNESSSSQYTLLGNYSDASQLDLTGLAVWSENSPNASIGSNTGLLTVDPLNVDQTADVMATYGGLSDTNTVDLINVPTPPALVLESIEIIGASSLTEKESSQYALFAKYSGGSETNVTALGLWSVDTTNASIGASTGFLTVFDMDAITQTVDVVSGYLGFGATNPVVLNGLPPNTNETVWLEGGAPMIAEWIRSGTEDRTIAFTSEETLSSVIYQDENIVETLPVTSYADGYHRVTLPTGAGGYAHLLPVAGATMGAVCKINNTIAWWLGPDLCDKSETFSIYGNNLSPDGGDTYAYISTYGWITNASGNNQKATFDVPDDLSDATYTVTAWNGLGSTNGLGGDLGWSKEHTFKVQPLLDYSANTYNVTADNFGSLYDLIDDAPEYSTINVPPGTYEFTKEIYANAVNNNIWIKGAGTNQTFFVPASTYVTGEREKQDLLIDFGYQWSTGTQYTMEGVRISGITFDRGDGSPLLFSAVRVRGGNNRIEDCLFTDENLPQGVYGGYSIFSVNGSEGDPAWVKDCVFYQTAPVEVSSYVQFSGNEIYSMLDGPVSNDSRLGKMITLTGAHNTDISDNYGAQYSETDVYKSGQGRFIVAQNSRSYHLYVGANETKNLKPFSNSGHHNTGEQILFENVNPEVTAYVTASGSNWVTATGIDLIGTKIIVGTKTNSMGSVDSGYIATIIKGRGFGQTRPVVAPVDNANATVYLLENWLIEPDTSSVVEISRGGWRDAIVGNFLDGIDNLDNTASAAVSFYGGPCESLAVGNTAHEIEDGFVNWTYASEDPLNVAHANYAYFNVFEENIVTNPAWHTVSSPGGGMGYYVNSYGPDVATPSIGNLGVIFRDNKVYGVEQAIAIVGEYNTYTPNLTVFEFNSGTSDLPFVDARGVHTYTNNNTIIEL